VSCLIYYPATELSALARSAERFVRVGTSPPELLAELLPCSMHSRTRGARFSGRQSWRAARATARLYDSTTRL